MAEISRSYPTIRGRVLRREGENEAKEAAAISNKIKRHARERPFFSVRQNRGQQVGGHLAEGAEPQHGVETNCDGSFKNEPLVGRRVGIERRGLVEGKDERGARVRGGG